MLPSIDLLTLCILDTIGDLVEISSKFLFIVSHLGSCLGPDNYIQQRHSLRVHFCKFVKGKIN